MERPEVRWTSAVLVGGTLLSVGCLVVGLLLTLLGGAGTQTEDPRRLELVLRSAVELQPWGWSMLGVLTLLATPAAGLVASALELRRTEPRTALVALVVLAVLVAAAGAALVG
jgi:uncharacterized membrane protein